MLSDEFLRKLDSFQLPINARVRGGAGGARRSRAQGSSAEFSDFREYVPGDDIRRIDWNAYARFDRLFLKLFTEEQDSAVNIIIDASASMQFDGKAECTRNLALLVAYVALRNNDRVTLAAIDGHSARSDVLSGRTSFMKAVNYVEHISFDGKTSLDMALPRLNLRTGRGLCVIISDFLGDNAFTHGCDALLYQGQQLAMLQVLADSELNPALDGPVKLIDSESSESVELMISGELLKEYNRRLTEFMDGLRKYALRHSTQYIMLRAQDDFEATMVANLSRAGIIA